MAVAKDMEMVAVRCGVGDQRPRLRFRLLLLLLL